MSDSLTKQLKSIYLYTFFTGMMFWYGIEQLFLEDIGDGVFARGATLAAFSFTMFLATVPAGALTDVWGRVRSLKVAVFLMVVSVAIMAVSGSVFTYSIGAIVFALYWSFDEGAKEAFVYDLLVDEKQQKQYQRVLGRIYAALLVGAAISNFASGFIADATNLHVNYWISVIPAAAAFFNLMQLHEPEHHKQLGKKVMSQLDDAFRAMSNNSVLLIIVIGQTLIFLISDIAGEFAQPAIVEHTDSAIVVGVAWGLLGLIMAAGNLWAHKVREIFSFMIVTLLMLIAYFVFSAEWGSILALFAFVAAMEVISIRGEGALQKNTPSNLRATIASIPGSSATFAIGAVGLWVGGAEGSVAYRVFVVSALSLVTVFLLWLRIREQIPQNE